LFLDTADIEAIELALGWGVCDGVTTNPSIMLKCGVNSAEGMEKRAKDIAVLIRPRPLSVEVVADDHPAMLYYAKQYAAWADNIAIKIPVTTTSGQSCLPVVKMLSDAGIAVNVTAMMTFGQLMLAAKAGARYLSLFGGRIDDEGNDATEVIRQSAQWLNNTSHDLCIQHDNLDAPEIIVGSTRTVKNIADWALAGAHIITVTPDLLGKMVVNARTKETVAQFLADGEKALSEIA